MMQPLRALALGSILGLTLLLVSPPPMAAQDDQTTTYQAKTASVPAPATMSVAALAAPPLAETADAWQAALSQHHRPGPMGTASPEAMTLAAAAPAAATQVSSANVQILQNRVFIDTETRDLTSTVLEPSIAVRGNEILYTANWFASFSVDGGTTFAYVNPGGFPTIPGQAFCCDQVAIYDASHDMMIWFLQHLDNGSQNTIRIAVATGTDIAAQDWRLYDFTPNGVGGWNNQWFDFPDLALGTNFLYVTTNTFTTSTDTFTRSVILRLPLAAMANAQALNFDFFDSTQDFSLRPTQGASDTMYFANHVTNARLRVFSWPENANNLNSAEIAVQGWAVGNAGGAGPDGPWLGRLDPRITAAWLTGTTAGFAWSVPGDADFPQPHVRAALIDTTNMTLVGQPHLWNPGFAYAYPAAGVNGNGEVGISVAFGGGTRNPSHAVGTFTAPADWQLATTVQGTNSPAGNLWGDYLTVRPDPQDPGAWYGTGYALDGGRDRTDVAARFVRFTSGGGAPSVQLVDLSPGRLDRGDSTTLRATVSQGGSPLPGVTVNFTVQPPNQLTLAPTTAITNAAGVADVTATATDGRGTAVVTASVGASSDTETVEVPDLSVASTALLLALLAGLGAASRRRSALRR